MFLIHSHLIRPDVGGVRGGGAPDALHLMMEYSIKTGG